MIPICAVEILDKLLRSDGSICYIFFIFRFDLGKLLYFSNPLHI